MFDDVIRELRRFEVGERIEVEVEVDSDGYLDRICPNPECNSDFKVLFVDWREKVKDEVVYCPICRFEADSGEWSTEEQQDYLREAARQHVQRRIHGAFDRSARRFNRSQPRNNLISMTMNYQPSPIGVLIPAIASEVMTERSMCELCECRYSSIGAAYFCPACGHNSAHATFFNSVKTVRRTIDALPAIQKALTNTSDRDIAESSVRHICENALVKLVSAFERYAEAMFDRLPNRSQFNPRRNVFQNIAESNELWRAAIGCTYDDMLSTSERIEIEIYFQQRHLLTHRDGIVDQSYLARCRDARYAAGQRLIVRGDTVQSLAELIEKLANQLRERGKFT